MSVTISRFVKVLSGGEIVTDKLLKSRKGKAESEVKALGKAIDTLKKQGGPPGGPHDQTYGSLQSLLTQIDTRGELGKEGKYERFGRVKDLARGAIGKVQEQIKINATLGDPKTKQGFDDAHAELDKARTSARALIDPHLVSPLSGRIGALSNRIDIALAEAGKGDGKVAATLAEVNAEADKIRRTADGCLKEAPNRALYVKWFDEIGSTAQQDIGRMSHRKWQRELAGRLKVARKNSDRLAAAGPETFPVEWADKSDVLRDLQAIQNLAASALKHCRGNERMFIRNAADTFPPLIGDDATAAKQFSDMQDLAKQADSKSVDDLTTVEKLLTDAYEIYKKLKATLEAKVAQPVLDDFDARAKADANSPEARMASVLPPAKIKSLLTEAAMGQAVMGVNAKALSPGELIAITNYTSDNFQGMNRFERSKGRPAEMTVLKPTDDANELKIFCEEFTKALNKLPVWKGGVVRRIETPYREAADRYQMGKTLVLNQFWSASTAGLYIGASGIEIYINPKTAHYIAPMAIEGYQAENEVTFPPGAKLTRTGGTASVLPDPFDEDNPAKIMLRGRVEMVERS